MPALTPRRRQLEASSLQPDYVLESVLLVLLGTLARMVGIVNVWFGVFARTTLQHDVHEGTRDAITYPVKSSMGQDASIRSVVRANATGFLASQSAVPKLYVRSYDAAT